MRIVFFGTPEFAVPSLEAVAGAGHEVLLVVSRPDQPAGRSMRLTAPAMVAAARRLGLPVAQPEKLGAEEFVGRLRGLPAELAVVVAFGRLLAPRLLAIPPRGFVNLHPSLLPRHRGPSPIESAILRGDEETGVTTMLLDEGMDTGPILLQRATPIGARERSPELERRLALMGAELVVETLAALAIGAVTPRRQDNARATVTQKLDRKMARIDWGLDAAELARRCRAFDPWPGLFASFRQSRVKVHGLEVAAPAPAPGGEAPGTVLQVSSDGILVRCGGDTPGLLTELQREGRRRLPADAFILGERVARGERFS
ncbi:MAG: methionyl-tRNA formyltransferase [Acidobacteriota bacterium]